MNPFAKTILAAVAITVSAAHISSAADLRIVAGATQTPVLLDRADNILFNIRIDAPEGGTFERLDLQLDKESARYVRSVKLYYSGTDAVNVAPDKLAATRYILDGAREADPSYSILKAERRAAERVALAAPTPLFRGINYFWVSVEMRRDTPLTHARGHADGRDGRRPSGRPRNARRDRGAAPHGRGSASRGRRRIGGVPHPGARDHGARNAARGLRRALQQLEGSSGTHRHRPEPQRRRRTDMAAYAPAPMFRLSRRPARRAERRRRPRHTLRSRHASRMGGSRMVPRNGQPHGVALVEERHGTRSHGTTRDGVQRRRRQNVVGADKRDASGETSRVEFPAARARGAASP